MSEVHFSDETNEEAVEDPLKWLDGLTIDSKIPKNFLWILILILREIRKEKANV